MIDLNLEDDGDINVRNAKQLAMLEAESAGTVPTPYIQPGQQPTAMPYSPQNAPPPPETVAEAPPEQGPNAVEQELAAQKQADVQAAESVAKQPTVGEILKQKSDKAKLFEAAGGGGDLGDPLAVEQENSEAARRGKVMQAFYALGTRGKLGSDFFAPEHKDPDAQLKREILRSQIAKNMEERSLASKAAKDKSGLIEGNKIRLSEMLKGGEITQGEYDSGMAANTTNPDEVNKNMGKFAEARRLQKEAERRERRQDYQQTMEQRKYELSTLGAKGAGAQRALGYLKEYDAVMGGKDAMGLRSAFDNLNDELDGALYDAKTGLSAEAAKALSPEMVAAHYSKQLTPGLAKAFGSFTEKFVAAQKAGASPEKAYAAASIDNPQVTAIDTAYKDVFSRRQHNLAGANLTKNEEAMVKSIFQMELGATPQQKLIALQVLEAAEQRTMRAAWDRVAALAENDPVAAATVNSLVRRSPYGLPRGINRNEAFPEATIRAAPTSRPAPATAPTRQPTVAPPTAAGSAPGQPPVPGARWFNSSKSWKVQGADGKWAVVQ